MRSGSQWKGAKKNGGTKKTGTEEKSLGKIPGPSLRERKSIILSKRPGEQVGTKKTQETRAKQKEPSKKEFSRLHRSN